MELWSWPEMQNPGPTHYEYVEPAFGELDTACRLADTACTLGAAAMASERPEAAMELVYASRSERASAPAITPHDVYMQRYDFYMTTLSYGGQPAMGSGFRVETYTPPPGDTRGSIPARAFTEYFADKKVPVADKTTVVHTHDIGHMPGYEVLLENPVAAALVYSAARTAKEGSDANCRLFAGAIDELSVSLAIVAYDYQATPTSMGHIRKSLEELLTLASKNRPLHERYAWRAAVEAGLHLPAYDAEARAYRGNSFWPNARTSLGAGARKG